MGQKGQFMLMKKLAAGAATTAIALSIGAIAHAQSTATQAQEVVVTGARAARSTAGLATQVNDAKDESIIGQQFIAAQLPSANIGQLINMLPGVSYSTEDPGGFNSGDLRIHGFDGAHVAFILDGAPLNDTGNYAVYPGEYMIGELLDHITVNIGSSDVDSPSASALGATINAVTKKPSQTPGAQLKLSGGSYGYQRVFGEVDTGAFGPFGTTAYVAVENGREDNFADRPGGSERQDISGRIYQPLKGTDFLSVAGIYSQERQNPVFNLSAADRAALGPFYLGDNYRWVPEVAQPGVADTYPTGIGAGTSSTPGVLLNNGVGGAPKFSSDSNYYNLFSNPVNFASIRGQSKFTLLPNLVFTFDPSFFYTLANGGGGTTLSESDHRLIGAATAANHTANACVVGGVVTGVDLNGDGDCKDTVVAYGPSNTETYRYTVNSSLLYDFNEHHHFQLAYTYDLGRHRQTGEYTYVNPTTGNPDDVFGGKPGYGAQIIAADGRTLQKRDRASIAILNQISANYIGKFMDDRLHINIGVRAPFFQRKLDNFCDTYNGTTVYCAPINTAAVQAAYNTDLAANRPAGSTATALTSALTSTINSTIKTGPNGVPNFRFPFKGSVDYSKVLPNLGATYRLTENNLFYVSYAAGFSAPKTDDLYTAPANNVRPETSNNFAAGYRYQTRSLNASINAYDTEYKNRIEQTFDPNDVTSSIDRNVGNARVYGVDFEAGWTPIDHLHLYGSANFNHSELLSNYTYATSTGVPYIIPAKGKELVLTPERTFSARATYDMGPITVGAESKYISSRFVSDVNDSAIGGFAVFNVDARWNIPYFTNKTYVQMNILNLFNRQYISRVSTSSTVPFTVIPAGAPAGAFAFTPFYYEGAPSTFSITLNAQF